MKVGIFGSCVSRDTCEFWDEATVEVYVARHSVTSLETPHGGNEFRLGVIESEFQRRMVINDIKGQGLINIVEKAEELDLVIIDLIDERRGYWKFPDGTTMTNSIEIESYGFASSAAQAGARLIEFGTSEHYSSWKSGFDTLMQGLRSANLWERTLLLDVEWALDLEGARHPLGRRGERLGRMWRRALRASKIARTAKSEGSSVFESLRRVKYMQPTEAERFSDRARVANALYSPYHQYARSRVAMSVRKSSDDLRISPNHKWGPQPFHYRDDDYVALVSGIKKQIAVFDEEE